MRRMWSKSLGMVLLLAILGCRTPQPNLKPAPGPEVFNTPPTERRYNASVYPREAFNSRDPLKKLHSDQGVVPVKGPSLGPGYGTGAGGVR